METFFKAIGFVAVFTGTVAVVWVMGVMSGLIQIPMHTITNTVQTTHDVTDKVINADQALYNYEWFKDQEESIKKVRIQEEQAKQAITDFKADLPRDRQDWDDSDKDKLAYLEANKMGFTYELDSEIADWNSNSSKVNRNIWKNNLPMTINRTILTAKAALTDREGKN